MELTFSKRALLAGIVAVLGIVGAAILISRIKTSTPHMSRTALHPSATSAPTQAPADLLTDDAAGEVVRETVTAYFSIDPADKTAWVQTMSEVAADPETVQMLESVVWPVVSRANSRSSPSHVLTSKVLAGYDTVAHRRWEVWEAQVSGLSTWPAPAPQPIGPFAIPWAMGSEVSVYVTVFEQGGRWKFGLFPVDELVKEQLGVGTPQALRSGDEP